MCRSTQGWKGWRGVPPKADLEDFELELDGADQAEAYRVRSDLNGKGMAGHPEVYAVPVGRQSTSCS